MSTKYKTPTMEVVGFGRLIMIEIGLRIINGITAYSIAIKRIRCLWIFLLGFSAEIFSHEMTEVKLPSERSLVSITTQIIMKKVTKIPNRKEKKSIVRIATTIHKTAGIAKEVRIR